MAINNKMAVRTVIAIMNPEEYFNPTFFTDYFKSKLRLKKGGALDGLTPDTFWKKYERELEVISVSIQSLFWRFER